MGGADDGDWADPVWEQPYLRWASTLVWEGDNCLIDCYEVELYYSESETAEAEYIQMILA